LWFAVAQALGFQIASIRSAFTPFVDLIRPFCGSARVLSAHPRRFNSLPDIVFLDLGSLPWGPGSDKYWEGWRTTHVFFCSGEDTDADDGVRAPPPPAVPHGVVLTVGCTLPPRGRGGNLGQMVCGGLVPASHSIL
jgi:hypothetical protein